MSKRGIKNYLEVITSDIDYDIDAVDASIEAFLVAMLADESTTHFDTANGDIPIQKEPTYEESEGEEDNDGAEEGLATASWMGVGLDRVADNPMRDTANALKGASKFVFVFDRNSGTIDRMEKGKINMKRKRIGNGLETWAFKAMSTNEDYQSSITLPIDIVV